MSLIKHYFENGIGTTGKFNKKELLNGDGVSEALNKIDFVTPEAKQIVQTINDVANARGNIINIASALDKKFIKPTVFQKGIATTMEGATKTTGLNAIRQVMQKYIPYFGDDAALLYHLREAAKNAKLNGTSFKDYIDGLSKKGYGKETIDNLNNFREDLNTALKQSERGEASANGNAKTNELISQINELKNNGNNNSELQAKRRELEQELNIHPNEEFGENHAEFYHDGTGAIEHLINQRSGQVVGAFHRNDLGDIDLVWGKTINDNANPKEIKGYGLSKILSKHSGEFNEFEGNNEIEKVSNAFKTIIDNGKIEKTHNGYTIRYKNYILGLNKGWNQNGIKKGDNHWVVTMFKNDKETTKRASAGSFTKGASPKNSISNNTIPHQPEKNLKGVYISDILRSLKGSNTGISMVRGKLSRHFDEVAKSLNKSGNKATNEEIKNILDKNLAEFKKAISDHKGRLEVPLTRKLMSMKLNKK